MIKHSLFALSVSVLALGACSREAAAPEAAEAPAVQLYAMNCGQGSFADVGMFADDHSLDGQPRDIIVPCYLIRHPAGDLIWDTGLPEALADAPNGVTALGGTLTMPVRVSAQLQQLGLTPADIEYVSFSHAHSDHSGNGNMFAASTWIVDADERAYMFNDEHRADAESFANYNQLENAPTELIEGDADRDVFGDGSVTIIQTPGHTPGHTILRVNLANAGAVLLTGDMWHMAESRERRLVPTFNVDRTQTLASMDKIEALARETNARVVRQHVREDFDAMPRFPEALN